MKKACTNHIEIGSSDSVTSWFIIDNYCDVFVCHCNDWSLPRKWINNVSKCYNNSGILSAPYAIWFQSSNQLSHWDCWFLRQIILKINTFLSSNKLLLFLLSQYCHLPSYSNHHFHSPNSVAILDSLDMYLVSFSISTKMKATQCYFICKSYCTMYYQFSFE